MKANLEIVLEIDGRRFELTPEEAAELARKLQALGHGIQPAPAPIPWPGPYTYPEPVYPHWQGNGTGDPMPPNVKIWCGSAGDTQALVPEIQVLTSAAAEPVTWKGNRILSEADLSRMDFPYPPEPEL